MKNLTKLLLTTAILAANGFADPSEIPARNDGTVNVNRDATLQYNIDNYGAITTQVAGPEYPKINFGDYVIRNHWGKELYELTGSAAADTIIENNPIENVDRVFDITLFQAEVNPNLINGGDEAKVVAGEEKLIDWTVLSENSLVYMAADLPGRLCGFHNRELENISFCDVGSDYSYNMQIVGSKNSGNFDFWRRGSIEYQDGDSRLAVKNNLHVPVTVTKGNLEFAGGNAFGNITIKNAGSINFTGATRLMRGATLTIGEAPVATE